MVAAVPLPLLLMESGAAVQSLAWARLAACTLLALMTVRLRNAFGGVGTLTGQKQAIQGERGKGRQVAMKCRKQA